jgi:hypothetical protein
MVSFYDEVEIEDFTLDAATDTYYYPCPCGDRFQITLVCRLSANPATDNAFADCRWRSSSAQLLSTQPARTFREPWLFSRGASPRVAL